MNENILLKFLTKLICLKKGYIQNNSSSVVAFYLYLSTGYTRLNKENSLREILSKYKMENDSLDLHFTVDKLKGITDDRVNSYNA